jgi:hypothetical protein
MIVSTSESADTAPYWPRAFGAFFSEHTLHGGLLYRRLCRREGSRNEIARSSVDITYPRMDDVR